MGKSVKQLAIFTMQRILGFCHLGFLFSTFSFLFFYFAKYSQTDGLYVPDVRLSVLAGW